MDLIQAIKQVEAKDKKRNQLLGQKSMLSDSLKELGFKNINEAKKASTKLKSEIAKMEEHYITGIEKFKKQFSHLLN
ncbi:MAG: hypothetical protein ACTSWD_11655 [Candidatus Heimdallarchaeota archaeon]